MTEVTKQDVVAFRNSLITQVSAKTANHDLKALKILFKSARRDGVVTEDPTEFVETVRRERRPKIKRPCTLPELRSAGEPTKHEDELIVPAREGGFGCCAPRVKRASNASCSPPHSEPLVYSHRPRKAPFNEADRTELKGNVIAYIKSKTIAEGAAWEFIARERRGLELLHGASSFLVFRWAPGFSGCVHRNIVHH